MKVYNILVLLIATKKRRIDIMMANMDKETLVEKIVNLEWEAFDQVDNEGGRADCQDDFQTFSIMRKSFSASSLFSDDVGSSNTIIRAL